MIKLFKDYEIASAVPIDELFEEYYLQFLLRISGGAVTSSPQSNPIASRLIVDADSDETAENNVTGTTGSMFLIDVDNTANGAASFLKIYDAASPTVGTTAPDWIFKIPASVRRVIGCTEGLAFGTALSFATVTAGGTAGVTGPTSDVIVRILTS